MKTDSGTRLRKIRQKPKLKFNSKLFTKKPSLDDIYYIMYPASRAFNGQLVLSTDYKYPRNRQFKRSEGLQKSRRRRQCQKQSLCRRQEPSGGLRPR